MDPADTPGGVDPFSKTSCMDGKMQRHSQFPPPLEAADSVSRVLDDDDLLIEIIVRLGLPTSLIRAILVCKRWFFIVSNKAFLRRFRSLHPPRLLGFYVSTRSTDELLPVLLRPCFVSMLPQPPELATAVRLAENYSLEAYDEELACILDCQNDTILLHGFQGKKILWGVHWPLCPERGVVEPPMAPYDQFDGASPAGTCAQFLLKEEGDGKSLTFIWLSMAYLIEGKKYSIKYKANIYTLQDGLWHWRSSAAAVLPSPRSDLNPLLSGNKIYMEHSTSIAALNLTTSNFTSIPLPEGMERYICEDMMMSRANDSGIYLIHLEILQLRIWLHRGDNSGSMRNWLLLDDICLREMLDALGMAGGEQPTLLNTSETGDNLQFVFLKMGQCALYLDIKHRELRKVYEVTEDDRTLERIYPFMMTWPPTFPVLKNDPARTVERAGTI
uniref:F-box protein AT5G49610-like beta-propeller domain-containing protein n=1 Tax=Aegilops tauschii subsp. strangulata TaxID=200361 RepID=A0A453AG82_AEGTS